VKGWAIDPETGNPIEVRITVDGLEFARRTADLAWPDLQAAFGTAFYGINHGFDFWIPAQPGTHLVCLDAVDKYEGGWLPQERIVQLGCQQVTTRLGF
jgi:hypothetical protein